MTRAAAKCRVCGKTVTPEEVETGQSLVCPVCDPNAPKPKQQAKAAERPRERK